VERPWDIAGQRIASLLLVAYAICLLFGGATPRAFFTLHLIEWMTAILVLLVVERTAQRCSGYVKAVWRLLEFAYILYASAQILWVFTQWFPGVAFFHSFMSFLFNMWFVPLSIAILLEPDRNGRWFHTTLIADMLQAVIFALVACRSFQIMHRGWVTLAAEDRWISLPYFVYYAAVIGAFFLRSRTSRARNRRALFRQLGILLSLSCLLDITDWFGLGARLPAIFHLRYPLVLCAPLIFVMRWNEHGEPDEKWELGQGRYSRITLLLPSLYPALILYMAATILRNSVNYVGAMVALSFLTFSARQLITQDRLQRIRKSLERQATHDALTGLWNRAAILNILELELQRAERTHQSVGVVMLDVDHFKMVNDLYGHTAGDHMLRKLAQVMASMLRPYDSLGRWGGEEFLIVVPLYGASAATLLAERIRETVAAAHIDLGSCEVSATISAGVATATWRSEMESALHAADEACYQAKKLGRNRVEVASPQTNAGTGVEEFSISHAYPGNS